MTNVISFSIDEVLVKKVDDIVNLKSKKTNEKISRSEILRVIIRNTLKDEKLMKKWRIK